MPHNWEILLILAGLTAFLVLVWMEELCKRRRRK